MAKLTVRSRFDDDMKDDMVRIDRTQRNGIRSGRICRLVALDNDSEGAITRYVEVKGIGTTPSDLVPYVDKNPNEPKDHAAYVTSVFMDESTRIKFYVKLGETYEFRISNAGLFGNLRYFIAHPDRYAKTLAWAGIVGVVLAVGGYSIKDWLTTPEPKPPTWPVLVPAGPSSPAEPPSPAEMKNVKDYLVNGDYKAAESAAIAALRGLTGRNRSELAFLLAQASFSNQDFERAARAYGDAYDSNPQGPLAADSLLGRANAFVKASDYTSACKAVNTLRVKFPEKQGLIEQSRTIDDAAKCTHPSSDAAAPIVIADADSGWIDGGSSPNKFCDPQLQALQSKYPEYQIKMTILPEQHRSVYTPFKHDVYRYTCSFAATTK